MATLMLKILYTFTAALFFCNGAFAQQIIPNSSAFSPSTSLSSNPSIRTNGSASVTQAARAAYTFNAKDFGAIGTGTATTANSALGITTLASLTGYTASNGATPYSWAGTYPFGTLFNLAIHAAATNTATTLNFHTTVSSGVTQTSTNPDIFVPTATAGITQGDLVVDNTSTCITNTTTQVEWYVPSTGEVRLSKPTAANCAGKTLQFYPSWFSNINPGGVMYVCAGTVSGTSCPTVSTITSNSTAHSITLSGGVGYTLTPISSTNPIANQVTFWQPFTNTQAQNLTMDYLGIQAAVQTAAGLASGSGYSGNITLPGGNYYVNAPIIFPVSAPSSQATGSVSMSGDGEYATYITATTDFGPGSALVSCGEPTASTTNGRGIYTSGGYMCEGEWRNFNLTTVNPGTYCGSGPGTCGYRPNLIGGNVPVAMNGFFQGPRKEEFRVAAQWFNICNEFQGDHTAWYSVHFLGCFINFRLNDSIPNLYEDLVATEFEIGGPSFASMSVAPSAGLSIHIDKGWFGDAPYLVYFESNNGNNSTYPALNGMIDTQLNQINFEGAGCSAIYDGTGPAGSTNRTVNNVDIKGGAFQGANSSYTLAGGCTWTTFITLYSATGLLIDDISSYSFLTASQGFPPGGTGIISVNYAGSAGNPSSGGIYLRGSGLATIFPLYATNNAEIVTSPSLNMYFSGTFVNIGFENPGVWSAKEYASTTSTTLVAGNLMETTTNSPIAAELGSSASSSGTAIPLGVIPFSYTGSMNNKFVVIADKGSSLPLSVASTTGLSAGSCLSASSSGSGNFALSSNCLSSAANPRIAVITTAVGTPSYGQLRLGQ